MKVSIVIPTYNNPEELNRLLNSCKAQDFEDYEICISDDSTDERIAKLVKEKEADFEPMRINYHHNEKRLGHIINWNAAIDMACGEYIKIMFSDDFFTYDDSLSKMVKMLDENENADFCFCNSMQVSTNTENKPYKREIADDYIERLKKNYRYVFISNQIGAPSCTMFRKNYKNTPHFDERSNWASDVFLYLEILSRNSNFVSTDEPLISIGMSDEQYTYTFEEYDKRKLNDYALLYRKYNLKDDTECSRHFKEYKKENISFRRKNAIKKLLGITK